jgi:hypothetical protein
MNYFSMLLIGVNFSLSKLPTLSSESRARTSMNNLSMSYGLLLMSQVWASKIGDCSLAIKIIVSGFQDPAMSGMLSNLTNPDHKDQLEQRMAAVREDPTLKPVLEEIETGGPAAMMK